MTVTGAAGCSPEFRAHGHNLKPTMTQPTGEPCYFATWTGYAPPFRPHAPITYAEAETSRAFTAFVFDEQGRAVAFENWMVTTAPYDPSALAGRSIPAGKAFFAPDAADAERPGTLLSLNETCGLAAYFRAQVHPDGAIATLEHVRRERTIRHDYRYWEDGRLREWRFESGDERGVDEFDREGRRVSSVTERSEG